MERVESPIYPHNPPILNQSVGIGIYQPVNENRKTTLLTAKTVLIQSLVCRSPVDETYARNSTNTTTELGKD